MSINLLASAARFATQMLPTVARAARGLAQVAPQALPRMGQRLSSSMGGLASRPMLGRAVQKLMEEAVDVGLSHFSSRPSGPGGRPTPPWGAGRPPDPAYGPVPGTTPPFGGSTPGGFGASHRPARPHAAGSDPWSQFRQGFKQEYSASGPTPQDFGAESWSGVAKKAGQQFAQGFRQGVARAEQQRRWQNMSPPSDDPGASAPPRDGMPRPSRPHPASGPDPRHGPRPQAQGRTRQGPRPSAPPTADTSSDMTRAALASMGLSEGAEAHQILGVSRSASAQEIRLAYRRQQLKHHPDRNHDSPHATRASQLILEAYETMRAAAR